jgi:hypothetical protein
MTTYTLSLYTKYVIFSACENEICSIAFSVIPDLLLKPH